MGDHQRVAINPEEGMFLPEAIKNHHAAGKIRVLFLNPPSLKGEIWMKEVGRCGRRSIAGEVWPQTGLAYMAAMVEREGHSALIIDAMADPVSVETLENRVRDFQPHIIIANSATPTIKNDAVILDKLSKVSNALCGFSGPHVSALPEETLLESSADFGIINEAEETVADLTRCAATANGNETILYEALCNIKGIAWKRQDASNDLAHGSLNPIVVNPPRPLLTDLDLLPLPARHLLPNHFYHMPFFGNHPFATLIPTRGCPWPCTFCRAGRVWGRKIRVRSVDNIMDEIGSLQDEFGINHVVFMTDSLTLNRQWTETLFQRLIDLPKRLEWICNSRVDAVDTGILELMKRAGCRQIAYGLESGSQTVLDQCRKGITLDQSENAIRLTRKAGLQSMAYFVLGLPGETPDTINESIRFAARIRPDYVNFHVATPFPGTELYDQAQKNGWLTSSDWNDFEEEGSAVMRAGELTPIDLMNAQRRAMRSFYMRPSRLLNEVLRLRSWAEFSAKARAGLKIFSLLSGDKHA